METVNMEDGHNRPDREAQVGDIGLSNYLQRSHFYR